MRIAALAAAFAVTAGTALAQPAPPPPGPPAGGPEARAMPPGAESRPGPGPMMGYGPPGRGRHHGPPPRGASFHFERGEMEITIRCPENEPVRACVDAAVVLLDRLAPPALR